MGSEAGDIRLDVKTNSRAVERQARRAGLKSGMRVADLDCNCLQLLFITLKGGRPFVGVMCFGVLLTCSATTG